MVDFKIYICMRNYNHSVLLIITVLIGKYSYFVHTLNFTYLRNYSGYEFILKSVFRCLIVINYNVQVGIVIYLCKIQQLKFGQINLERLYRGCAYLHMLLAYEVLSKLRIMFTQLISLFKFLYLRNINYQSQL